MSNTATYAVEELERADPIPGLDEAILRRWSPKAFANRPIPSSDMKKSFEAAQWAASSINERPWRFLVRLQGEPTYCKTFESLAASNQPWVNNTSVLMLSIRKKAFTQIGNPNHYALHDTGAATASLALQATTLGFHVHSMGRFDRDKIGAPLEILDDFEIGAATASAIRPREPLERCYFISISVFQRPQARCESSASGMLGEVPEQRRNCRLLLGCI